MLRSLAIATLAKCRYRPWRCLFDVLGVAWFIVWSHIYVRFARGLPDEALVAKRTLFCNSCPLFSEYKTCGTPGETYIDPETNKAEPLGCNCYMPWKAKLHVNCWLWEKTNGEHGWPDELNASVYAKKQ